MTLNVIQCRELVLIIYMTSWSELYGKIDMTIYLSPNLYLLLKPWLYSISYQESLFLEVISHWSMNVSKSHPHNYHRKKLDTNLINILEYLDDTGTFEANLTASWMT